MYPDCAIRKYHVSENDQDAYKTQQMDEAGITRFVARANVPYNTRLTAT